MSAPSHNIADAHAVQNQASPPPPPPAPAPAPAPAQGQVQGSDRGQGQDQAQAQAQASHTAPSAQGSGAIAANNAPDMTMGGTMPPPIPVFFIPGTAGQPGRYVQVTREGLPGALFEPSAPLPAFDIAAVSVAAAQGVQQPATEMATGQKRPCATLSEVDTNILSTTSSTSSAAGSKKARNSTTGGNKVQFIASTKTTTTTKGKVRAPRGSRSEKESIEKVLDALDESGYTLGSFIAAAFRMGQVSVNKNGSKGKDNTASAATSSKSASSKKAAATEALSVRCARALSSLAYAPNAKESLAAFHDVFGQPSRNVHVKQEYRDALVKEMGKILKEEMKELRKTPARILPPPSTSASANANADADASGDAGDVSNSSVQVEEPLYEEESEDESSSDEEEDGEGGQAAVGHPAGYLTEDLSEEGDKRLAMARRRKRLFKHERKCRRLAPSLYKLINTLMPDPALGGRVKRSEFFGHHVVCSLAYDGTGNRLAGRYQAFAADVLVAYATPKRIHEYLSHFGIVPSYQTTMKRLKRIAAKATPIERLGNGSALLDDPQEGKEDEQAGPSTLMNVESDNALVENAV